MTVVVDALIEKGGMDQKEVDRYMPEQFELDSYLIVSDSS